jgi:hypothetical protein
MHYETEQHAERDIRDILQNSREEITAQKNEI